MQKPSKWPGHMETVVQEISHTVWPCTEHPADMTCEEAWRRLYSGIPLHSAPGSKLRFDTHKEEETDGN